MNGEPDQPGGGKAPTSVAAVHVDDLDLPDDDMRRALQAALEPGERPRAAYAVSMHVWVKAVLTDRSLLFIQGAVRPKVTRLALPLEVLREPRGSKQGVRIRTHRGPKTLWGAQHDPEMQLLLGARNAPRPSPGPSQQFDRARVGGREAIRQPTDDGLQTSPVRRPRLTRHERAEARRLAGPKPRPPRRQKARRVRVGFPPPAKIWDISYHCIKCGRALTNPNSQRHRVGTDCIKRYGSQARQIPNPAHIAWKDRKARAEINRVAEQAAYDAQYARAQEAYKEVLRKWLAVREGRAG